MNCSQHDLKDYIFGEPAEADRRAAEAHLKGCQDCRDELERLRLTHTALLSLQNEESPRQIAFVSDKVFEPRGWAWLWNSTPRLAFASAVVLSVAIMVHAFVRPAPILVPGAVDTAALEARLESEVAKRLEAVLEKTAAESEARQARRTAELVATAERRMDERRQADLLTVEESFLVLQKKMNVYRAGLAGLGVGGGQ